MSAVSFLNPQADVLRHRAVFLTNANGCQALVSYLQSNLGPKGTYVMLVGGAGQIKITKDGNVLLQELQIMHPTAAMVARAATTQDMVLGDGTTSVVILIGELLKHCESYIIGRTVHPHYLCDGIDLAKDELLKFMDACKVSFPKRLIDRHLMQDIARTALRTKLRSEFADQLTDIIVDAVQCIQKETEPLDLFMVEILSIKQSLSRDTRFIRGMVMDHGARHPDMPKYLQKCYILTCNVSLEYEKTEVNSGFFYSTVEQRSKLVEAERRFTDEKVRKIIELKKKVCTPENGMNFVVFNQKGIDPPSLDLLAKENILALRRVKRRNMERLSLCCGGNPVNSVYDLTIEDLGFAGEVYEESLEDEKWTYVEHVKDPKSCAILVKGPTDHDINQTKDAIRDGLRAIKNLFDDEALLPGAGAFEVAAYSHLQDWCLTSKIVDKRKFGVLAFAESLLSIPKALCKNAGFDAEDCFLKLLNVYKTTGKLHGVDINTGEPCDPTIPGIWDNYCVKRQTMHLAAALTDQLLLVDEIIKAGKQAKGNQLPQ